MFDSSKQSIQASNEEEIRLKKQDNNERLTITINKTRKVAECTTLKRRVWAKEKIHIK
jgi:hypothetical protein